MDEIVAPRIPVPPAPTAPGPPLRATRGRPAHDPGHDAPPQPGPPGVLTGTATLHLPVGYPTAGCLLQTVWNVTTGRAPTHGTQDYDVFSSRRVRSTRTRPTPSAGPRPSRSDKWVEPPAVCS
ncbi:nucleotidyltransferase family protein [Streptomyces sp. NPDC005385]|uniref:nucleotidyltransferase family protein n=1 Tax=Streptomyces sp. NPDC005385 TaxID=3157039 RepID=UPI0033BE3C9E